MVTRLSKAESAKTPPLTFWQRVQFRLRWLRLNLSTQNKKIGDLLGVPRQVTEAFMEAKASGTVVGGGVVSDALEASYRPDHKTDALAKPTLNPVVAFHEALECGDHAKCRCSVDNPFKGKNLRVREAWLFEAQVDERGKILTDKEVREAIRSPWPEPTRLRHVRTHEAYMGAYAHAKKTHADMPKKAEKARESANRRHDIYKRMLEDGFLQGDGVPSNMFSTTFDPNQYSEYAPLMGGPYFRQLYIYDFLQQQAYAFEAQNHNPVAKAIIRILTQYALGRRFEVQIEDAKKKELWEMYERRTDFTNNLCNFWGKEAEIFGEFDFDWMAGISIDPATIWDIITDPDRTDIEYYAYQSYPTAYQTFTGYNVPGEPGAADQKSSEYIIRQIPAWKLVRMKLNCISNEKRGRSTLFSVLGWLKRIKDLYNAQVIREWLYSCFMWDVTLKNANASDINAYISANSAIPLPASKNVHNEAVEIKPLPALESKSRGGASIGDELMCFIAVAVGIPKEFLNVMMTGAGGSRASALTSAEPFTKMIEDIQARWEWFITRVFKNVMEINGQSYTPGDIEVTFPSVTKDTTSETIQNLTTCEEMKWFTHERCQQMAAKEMNVTQFDADEETSNIKDEERAGVVPNPAMPPAGRFNQPGNKVTGPSGGNPGGEQGGSDIHGQGKMDLVDDLTTI